MCVTGLEGHFALQTLSTLNLDTYCFKLDQLGNNQ